MKNFYNSGRRDGNDDKEFVSFFVENQIPYKRLMPGQGADYFILLDRVVFVEIKNPATSKVRQQLSKIENDLKAQCDERGIPYMVVFSIEELKKKISNFHVLYGLANSIDRRVM